MIASRCRRVRISALLRCDGSSILTATPRPVARCVAANTCDVAPVPSGPPSSKSVRWRGSSATLEERTTEAQSRRPLPWPPRRRAKGAEVGTHCGASGGLLWFSSGIRALFDAYPRSLRDALLPSRDAPPQRQSSRSSGAPLLHGRADSANEAAGGQRRRRRRAPRRHGPPRLRRRPPARGPHRRRRRQGRPPARARRVTRRTSSAAASATSSSTELRRISTSRRAPAPRTSATLFRNCRIIGRRFRLAHVLFGGGKVIEVATFRRNPVTEVPEEEVATEADIRHPHPQRQRLRRRARRRHPARLHDQRALLRRRPPPDPRLVRRDGRHQAPHDPHDRRPDHPLPRRPRPHPARGEVRGAPRPRHPARRVRRDGLLPRAPRPRGRARASSKRSCASCGAARRTGRCGSSGRRARWRSSSPSSPRSSTTTRPPTAAARASGAKMSAIDAMTKAQRPPARRHRPLDGAAPGADRRGVRRRARPDRGDGRVPRADHRAHRDAAPDRRRRCGGSSRCSRASRRARWGASRETTCSRRRSKCSSSTGWRAGRTSRRSRSCARSCRRRCRRGPPVARGGVGLAAAEARHGAGIVRASRGRCDVAPDGAATAGGGTPAAHRQLGEGDRAAAEAGDAPPPGRMRLSSPTSLGQLAPAPPRSPPAASTFARGTRTPAALPRRPASSPRDRRARGARVVVPEPRDVPVRQVRPRAPPSASAFARASLARARDHDVHAPAHEPVEHADRLPEPERVLHRRRGEPFELLGRAAWRTTASATAPSRRSTLHAIDVPLGTAWSNGSFARWMSASPSFGVKKNPLLPSRPRSARGSCRRARGATRRSARRPSLRTGRARRRRRTRGRRGTRPPSPRRPSRAASRAARRRAPRAACASTNANARAARATIVASPSAPPRRPARRS